MKTSIFFISLIFSSFLTYSQQSISIAVTDSLGNSIENAEVILYNAKRNWRIDSARYNAHPYYTNSEGNVTINNLDEGTYWFNIKHNYRTNRFTLDTVELSSTDVNITVPIRDLSLNEHYLCGTCDNKTWITDSIVINGNAQPYDADSKLLSDATWWDSNANHGFWWYNSDETILTYDYDDDSSNGGGSSVSATNITLTDSTFKGDMDMSGFTIVYYMSVQYDSVHLSLTGHDTTLSLTSDNTLNIIAYDLNLDHSYCFTCNYTLSQSNFTIDDIGENDIIISMTDRCGNTISDTITITISSYNPSNIKEVSDAKLKIYPNPTKDYLNIESPNNEIKDIIIYSVNGQVVKHLSLNKKSDNINISDLNKGYYFIKVYTQNNMFFDKFIVN